MGRQGGCKKRVTLAGVTQTVTLAVGWSWRQRLSHLSWRVMIVVVVALGGAMVDGRCN